MAINQVEPKEVFRINQQTGQVVLVDVREADEYQEVSSPLAELAPLSTFDAKGFAKNHSKQTAVYVICRSGRRSMKAGELLMKEGFSEVYNVIGGMIAWEEAGLPVVR